jgi:hypothetical protein
MINLPRFERPVQTIAAVSAATGISRTTILKAIKPTKSRKGLIEECAYRSGDAWLIDTSCQQFQQWLIAHPTQRRVRGKRTKEQPIQNRVVLQKILSSLK